MASLDRLDESNKLSEQPHTEPKILYDQNGALVIQIPEGKFESFLTDDEQIVRALAACGLTPEHAIRLLIQSQAEPVVSKDDQFTDAAKTQQSESVAIREIPLTDTSVSVLTVDYFPPAAHTGETIHGVFTKDAEIIYGLQGLGVLEIAPVVDSDDTLSLGPSMKIPISANTLAILPPTTQGNRWNSFGPSDGTMPSLTAIYVAFPGPYAAAEVQQLS